MGLNWRCHLRAKFLRCDYTIDVLCEKLSRLHDVLTRELETTVFVVLLWLYDLESLIRLLHQRVENCTATSSLSNLSLRRIFICVLG